LARNVQIERFDPATDTPAVRACHEIHLAERHADGVRRAPLSPRAFRTWLRYGWTEDPQESWLARDSKGEVCGWYLLGLPERENQHRAAITLVVAPSRRRAGLGSALLGHAADRARQAGRTLLTSHSYEATAGAAFARAIGARRRMTGVFWALRPRSLPAGRLARLRESAASAAAGYSLVSWEGPVADDRLAEVAGLFDVEEDAPFPEGEDPPSWDPARVRASDERAAEQGLRFYTVAARADRTGRLVAITQLGVDPLDAGSAFQELTAVARPHRGHRLGLLVKVAMLELLAAHEPQLTQIVTLTAEDNDHMNAINAELGFEVLERQLSWELEVARAPGSAGLAAPGVSAAQS
jgi:GNAT superfamily N-acetyltransferase/RimJ/RimL family protein N-acetyltransferase